jgi:hypothetical protein
MGRRGCGKLQTVCGSGRGRQSLKGGGLGGVALTGRRIGVLCLLGSLCVVGSSLCNNLVSLPRGGGARCGMAAGG